MELSDLEKVKENVVEKELVEQKQENNLGATLDAVKENLVHLEKKTGESNQNMMMRNIPSTKLNQSETISDSGINEVFPEKLTFELLSANNADRFIQIKVNELDTLYTISTKDLIKLDKEVLV